MPADEKSQAFLTQAVLAISDAYFYPAPVAMMMTDFKQVQASVFQVARAPGKNVVYLGCLLLIVGIFAMLYVRERRLWVWLAKDANAGGTTATMAFSVNRKTHRQRSRIRASQRQVARHQERGDMNTTTLTLNDGFLSRRNAFDWVFAALVLAGGLFAFSRYAGAMDIYEKVILLATMPAAIWLGWFWRPLRVLALVVAAAALLGIVSYQGDLARADTVFWLKYFLSSQSAILWMSVLFFMSTLFYWIGFFGGKQADTMDLIGSRLAWAAVTMALIGTHGALVRKPSDSGRISAISRSATSTRCSCCSAG